MIIRDFDLQHLNTLRLPARAEAFARFTSPSELLTLLDYAAQQQWPVRVLGGGSNILLADNIPGLVLQPAMMAIRCLEINDVYCRVAVDAGMNWHDWVVQSIQYGHGLENLALIPGTVGAAPVQNIGAYGVEVADCLEAVYGIQLSTRQWRWFSGAECRFSYRDSVFKQELAGDFMITRVVFRLQRQFRPRLEYGPLAQLQEVTPVSLIDAVCSVRRSKLPDPAHIPNAGSFFKNPVVSVEQAQQLRLQHPALPQYPQDNGYTKLAAGWLIEQAGWKGRWQGPVRMHDQQALVLTTDGSATFNHVAALRDAVVASVQKTFGVTLEPEPQVF